MHRIHLPRNLDLDGIIALERQLRTAPLDDDYRFDFGTLQFTSPFGLVLASTLLRRWRSNRPQAQCVAEGANPYGYAAHMGFFKAFGVNAGNAPGEAIGSSTYVPLTEISTQSLYAAAGNHYEEVQSAIERKAAELSEVLTQTEAGALRDTLTYSIREVLRNSVEHSRSSKLWFAAQYWPTRGLVDVAIADEGVGIRKTLSRNPHLSIESDGHALSLALLPGISGRAFEGAPRQRGDWANSGFGLFMTSRLCARGGHFFVGSGSAGLYLREAGHDRLEFSYTGVAIEMRMATHALPDVEKSLSQLRSEGEAMAKDLRGAVLTASAASSRLRRSDS